MIAGYSVNNGVWSVTVAYPIEGVGGQFNAKMLPNGEWKLLSAHVLKQ